MKKIISSKSAPAAIGPYSQAVEANGMLFISGQLPIDVATGAFVEGGVKEQTRKSLENIGAILSEAGMGFENVVKTTVFLNDMNDFAAMNEVYATFFTSDCPARAAFQVVKLPKGALVEIEAIAAK
ncbi:RidA family protein [bacterium]|nr:RidA family protein [bacterium]MBR6245030.1 RidA family protein [bacterium]